MSEKSRSIEEFLAELDREVAKLPPGSDLAGFITKRHAEFGEMLARRVVENREAASREAGFPPSGVPTLRPPGDEAGEDAPGKDRRSP